MVTNKKFTSLIISLIFLIAMNGNVTAVEEGDYIGVDWNASGAVMDVTNDNTYFWTTDYNDSVSKYSKNGILIKDFLVVRYPVGITQNGTYIWITNPDIDNSVIHRYYMNLTYFDNFTINVLNNYPMGMANNGTHLFVTNLDNKIFVYEMKGNYVSTLNLIECSACSSVTTDGSYLWVLDSTSSKVFKYTMNGSHISNWSSAGECTKCYGLTQNGDYFWVMDTGTSPNKAHQYYLLSKGILITDPGNTTYMTSNINLDVITKNPYNDTIWFSLDSKDNETLNTSSDRGGKTLYNLSEGPHNITAYAKDSSNNIVSDQVYFTIDTILPTITVTSPPNATIPDNTPDYNFTTSEVADLRYSLDGGVDRILENDQVVWNGRIYRNMTPQDGDILTESNAGWWGIVGFEEEETNDTTIVKVGSASIKFVRDATGEAWAQVGDNETETNWNLTGVSPLGEAYNYTNMEFWVYPDNPGEYIEEIRLHWSWCCYFNYTTDIPLANGSWNRVVVPLSGFGRVATTEFLSWEIIRWINISFNGGSIGDNVYIDGLRFNGGNLSEGSHYITVYANDTAGNPSDLKVYFTVDTIPPNITIASPKTQNETYNTTVIDLNVTTDETIDTWLYSLDGTGNVIFTPNTTKIFLNGSHNLVIYANDSAGNLVSREVNFTIDDKTPPKIIINSPENKTYFVNATDYNITVDEFLAWATVSIDGKANLTMVNDSITHFYTLGGTHENLTDGVHNVTFYVQDLAGNENRSTIYFEVNTKVPEISIISPLNQFYNTNVSFNISITNNIPLSSATVSVNGANHTLINGTNPLEWENDTITLGAGSYTITFYAFGSNGFNNSESVSFTIDTTPPTWSNNQTSTTEAGQSALFSVEWQDLDAGLSHYIFGGDNAGSWQNDTPVEMTGDVNWSNVTKTLNTAVGLEIVWRVWANDTAGNWKDTGNLNLITTDETPPSITITSPQNNKTYLTTSVDLRYSISDASGMDWTGYSLDAQVNETLAGNMTITGLSDGSHNITVYANDSLGNIGTSTVYFTISTPPPISDTPPPPCPLCGLPPSMGGLGSGSQTSRPSPILGGITGFIMGVDNIRDIIAFLALEKKQFYVVDPNLAGVVGALDYMPTTLDFAEFINKVTWNQVEILDSSDIYSLASDLVLKKFDVADRVMISRGDLGADSLASIAYAKTLNLSILLVEPNSMPEVTKNALKKLGTNSTIILGGPEAVSEEVEEQLPGPMRIGGEDRYDTAVQLGLRLLAEVNFDAVVVTDGENPDISAIMIAAKYGAPIVYTRGDEVPEVTKTFVEKRLYKKNEIILVGVSKKAEEELIGILP